MAKMGNNVVMDHVQGMIGKQVVFKRRKGKKYISAAPRVNKNREVGQKEQSNRVRFSRSTRYAKHAIKDPETKSRYTALAVGGQSAYNAAFKDAFHGPEIRGIITKTYCGNEGDIIMIQAWDLYKVVRVSISIYDSAKQLVEEGDAMDNNDGINWMYTSTIVHPNLAGSMLFVKVYDLPGNETIKEVML